MIIIDNKVCQKCGICISFFNGYCITETNGFPTIDYQICNQCQKCIAICPHQAISINGKAPIKISDMPVIGYKELISLLLRRRSIKNFRKQNIPKDIIEAIVKSSKYAPNQNKNIDILIINDAFLLNKIDLASLKFVKLLYIVMFSFKPLTSLISLFSKSLLVIKKKMERDLFQINHILKPNTNVLLLTIGDPKVPVTEMIAQYLLSTMILTATSLGIGSTLMDSLKLTFNSNKGLKKILGIGPRNKVLGVLALGYSNEKIVNIPNGYEVQLHWNKIERKSTKQ